LNEARDLAEFSSSLASEARRLEQAQRYDQSLSKWQALREAYPKYPDLDKLIEQTRGKQRQALLEAKGEAIRELQGALGICNYEEAERLLAQAKRDFAGDGEVAGIEAQLRDGVARRADAQKLVAAGMKSVGMAQWQKAAQSFKQAKERANADPVIGDQVLRALVQASEAALKSNPDAAEMLLGEAVRVQPGSQLLGPLKSKIQDHHRERMIEECSNAAARASSAGDFAGALQELGRVLAKYPDEPRLLQQRDEIQKQARKVEDEQRRVREQAAESGAAHDKPGEQLETQLFDPESPFAQAHIGTDAPAARESLSAPPPESSKVTPPPVVAPEPVKTDAPAIHAVPSESEFMAAGGTLAADETMLHVIEKELAVYVGPMARIMVKRAAAQTTDTDELYGMLAKSLERDKDRAAFMARKTELMKSRLNVPAPQPQPAGPLSSAMNPVSPLGITPEAIDHAARMLAAHVGPISGVLAKKAARKADSLQSLYRLLSEHVQNSKERRQFLRDAGFPET
jgi:tetratricopeptide (TPR) repeat protein